MVGASAINKVMGNNKGRMGLGGGYEGLMRFNGVECLRIWRDVYLKIQAFLLASVIQNGALHFI